MFVEERIYSLQPGKLGEFVRMNAEEGHIMQGHLGHLLGWYTTEVGPLHQAVVLWGHESFETRAAGFAALRQDPAWQDHLRRGTPLIRKVDSKLLVPAPFFAPRLEALMKG